MLAVLQLVPVLSIVALVVLLIVAGGALLVQRRRLAAGRAELQAVRRDKDVVLASISDQVTFLDADLRVVWSNWNDQPKQRAETAPEPGIVCHHAIAGRLEPCPGCPAPRVLRTGVAAEGEVACHDGSVLRMSAAPVRDEEGRVIGVVQTARDITDKRRLAEQLQQTQKMEAVGQLAAGVAHDFNNNLQVILGNAEMLAAEISGDGEHARCLESMMTAGRQARDVVRHLLTFSQHHDPRTEVLDLAELVRKQVDVLRRLVGTHVAIGLATAPDLPAVAADPSQVEQVLLNLCLNARDAMSDGGQLDLRLETRELSAGEARRLGVSPGAYVLLTVCDDGDGIAPDMQDRIFDPFFTTKEVDRGSGLGLSTVYGIVTAHGGFIELESEVGQGACFEIGWPATPATPATPAHEVPAADPIATVAPGTILVVEDEPAVRDLAVSVLERHGHDVHTAADGHEALARLTRDGDRYDVVVMDVMLPGLNGWTVYKRAGEHHPGLRVVFCSGHSTALLESEFNLEIPVLEFLQKPYRPGDLVQRVHDLLGRPGLANELRARQERG